MSIAETPFSVRSRIRDNAYPAIASMLFVASATMFLIFDRRPPFEYISTIINPVTASAGQSIVIQRHVVWHRKCEGVAFTEIVSSDHIVTTYDRGVRYPFELGETYADRSIPLPLSIRPGAATYRGVIKFSSCGITSRFHSIEVPYQEVDFEIR